MKIKSLLLSNNEDKVLFHQKACKLTGVNFPFEYFNRSLIRAFKDESNNIVGGYVLVTQAPLRVLESIPYKAKAGLDIKKIFEVTGLWMDPRFRSGKFSVLFWLQFSRDVSNQKDKDHYVYSYPLGSQRLKKLYSLARPKVLYEGVTKKLIGNTKESHESVEIACRSKIKYLPIYGYFSVMSQFIFKKRIHLPELFYFRTKQDEKRI